MLITTGLARQISSHLSMDVFEDTVEIFVQFAVPVSLDAVAAFSQVIPTAFAIDLITAPPIVMALLDRAIQQARVHAP